ncbi:aldolase/citrate lyase family protein [Fimbriimonas ginsengisoli]|uniref:Citrate lyase acyl carrier protein n=1 Tax=Fimbriimonas ginsengisoli Gsoil 348 TaxID=661478 RepID=A0A068NJF8_FIMGI|nr:aldolase/citrate lyase family protein [Fimbriimonas ginsengisoli]AIE83753.1 citrate lyase acyl carrier protein [Fimbriimonas ginsengisoli Gsoil 348]
MTQVGEHGPAIRSDVWIAVMDASKAGYDLTTSVEAIYGQSIRRQVEAALGRFGNPNVHLEIRDSGALPFALEARLEAALCSHLGLPLPALPARTVPKRTHLRRTRLYVPGNGPKLFPNAGLYRPDGLILDLEDSVAPDAKFAALAMVRRALTALDWDGSERMVRVNQGEQGMRDLMVVASQGVEAFLLPKIEEPEQVREAASRLDELGSEAVLLPLIESAAGIERAFEIASSSPRVAAITVGLEDYVTDLHAERTSEGRESAYAQARIVNAARAAGVSPLASVFPQVDDPDAMFEYARNARGLGFDGVGCIHPRQIRAAHRAFAPSAEELGDAAAIVAGFEAALAEGRGAVSVRGRMVDAPVYERAREVLARGGAGS